MGMIVGWSDRAYAELGARFAAVEGRGEGHPFRDHAALLAAMDRITFDAVVLQTYDPTGIDVCDMLARVRAGSPGTRVLIVSSSTPEMLAAQGVDLAAFDGYAGKPAGLFPPGLTRLLGLELAAGRPRPAPAWRESFWAWDPEADEADEGG